MPGARGAERGEWVDAVMRLQSLLPDGCRGPVAPREVRRDWFNGDRVPGARVYFENCPELQRKELTRVICAWFGASRPGSCAVMAINTLTEDSSANRGEIAKGAVAVRFAAVELADMFLKTPTGSACSISKAPSSSRILLPGDKCAATCGQGH